MAKMTGAQFLARFLELSGVQHVFWVPAVLMGMLRELEGSNRVSRILAHSEKSAVYMADGYARASGRPSVCFAQKIGAANLAAGLKDPYLACTPMVAIAGGARAEFENRHVYQQIDDATAFEPVTKSRFHVAQVDVLPEVLRQAFRSATTGTPGPSFIEIAGHLAEVELDEGDLEMLIEERFQAIPAFRPVADVEAIRRRVAPGTGLFCNEIYSGAGGDMSSAVSNMDARCEPDRSSVTVATAPRSYTDALCCAAGSATRSG